MKLLLQLKLHEALPNAFEYCDVLLPFRMHGRVREVEGTPTCGAVSGKWVSEKRRSRNIFLPFYVFTRGKVREVF